MAAPGAYTGNGSRRSRLKDVRLTRDLAVSGIAVWARYANTMRVDLTVRTAGVTGHLRGSWATRARGATAVLSGTIDGAQVRLAMPAP